MVGLQVLILTIGVRIPVREPIKKLGLDRLLLWVYTHNIKVVLIQNLTFKCMPNLDKTGPAGAGAKTGGQMGNCDDAKPQSRPFDGRGKGMGRGCGRKKIAQCPQRGFARRNDNT